ncbi:hypothetical protein VW23_023260 [Devosia insulae DS-56]|uniref:Egg lysin n=1 Tax=Devosia insulae DS-56 TaxID=1116389 RepID=A0A1E5XN14_9HYPH|nr:DUF3422 domain-containing protein [Devosia insulae]OEO30010.1 hypothetical protein VW23_023260 [Devosia insulae DS-56]
MTAVAEWHEHAYRRLIDAETHARPVLGMTPPIRIRRLAFMSADGGSDLRALHEQMAVVAGVLPEGPAWARQLAFSRDGRQVTWELHNEFATMTWSGAADDWDAKPLGIGLELHEKLLLVFATRIDVMPTDTIEPAALAGFNPLSLCYSSIFDDGAQAATDFHLDADGFTRFEVAAGRSGELRIGVIVRRLLEIETYRTMALIGLPLAREMGGRVATYERQLGAIMQQVGQGGDTAEDHQLSLEALHKLSVDISRTVEETSFRFAATQAYGEVLAERLTRLREHAIGEFTTIERFLNNRVHPALATCKAMEKRLSGLTEKVRRSISLLDARITLSIQTQNRSVLDAISQTGRSQYRLQLTVEGLSIIAISYYALGILGYIFEGLHEVLPFTKGEMLAVSAPLVVFLVFLGIRRLRGRHS